MFITGPDAVRSVTSDQPPPWLMDDRLVVLDAIGTVDNSPTGWLGRPLDSRLAVETVVHPGSGLFPTEPHDEMILG